MKRLMFATSLIVLLVASAAAQETETAGRAANQPGGRKQAKQIYLQSGTQLSAQLDGTLDVHRAKAGDRVALKTLDDVKQDGKVVIRKGSRLIGHVTEVQPQTNGSAESRIGLVFDRLRSGSNEIAIAASVLSVTSSHPNNSDLNSETMSQVSNNTSGAVGSTVAASNATTANVIGPLSGLQITQSSSTTAASGSTLILPARDLRIESGAIFKMAVSSPTSANP